MKRRIFFFLLMTLCNTMLWAQTIHSGEIILKWNETPVQIETTGGLTQQYLTFEGATIIGENMRLLPQFFYKKEVPNNDEYIVKIVRQQISTTANVYPKTAVGDDFKTEVKISEERGKYFLLVTIIPLRLNLSGQLEKLTHFDLEFEIAATHPASNQNQALRKSATHSILATGRWFQISTNADGIYRIDANLIQQMGLDISSFDPQNIRLYSMGNGNVPELNSTPRPDDLAEMAIEVVGENDHHFDVGDYVLFFGQKPDKLFYDGNNNFHHEKNLYSNQTYYFLTVDLGAGKRISTQASGGSPNTTVTSFDDYQYVDNDGINLAHTGRQWLDANDFESNPSHVYNFNFPNLITTEPLVLKTFAAAQTIANTVYVDVLVNGNTITSLLLGSYVPQYDLPIASYAQATKSINVSSGNVAVQMNLRNPNTGIAANAWMDYLVLQARRNLILTGSQMQFADSRSVGSAYVANFVVSNYSNQTIWDITHPLQPLVQQGIVNGSQFSFSIPTDSLHSFIAFNGAYLSPNYIGAVANQDIHGQIANSPEVIIVSHPDFLSAANSLASFHQNTLHQTTLMLPTTHVYQEFGGGKPDAGAIRDMVRAFYKAAGTDTSKMPKYLILIGDGSYDNRNITTGNTAFIPTYESGSSIDQASSFTSDDFYGLLSDNEGSTIESGNQLLDIAVGRLTVKTATEANAVVNKIINYKSNNTFGNWRNMITFVADDGDQNTHINDADSYTTIIASNHPEINIDKIYFDAYKEQQSSAGARYPDAHDAIIRRIESGTLAMNYTGHGSVIGWSHKRVFETPDIVDLTNFNKLPLFITATCEFSMYDQPDKVTAGEHLLLNENGGAIALMTTARLVYTGGNKAMNQNIYSYFFNKDANDKHLTIGEIFRLAKNATPQDDNNRKFTLLGDPAIALDFPEIKVRNLKINNHAINNDTLKAYGKYTINGQVTDKMGNLLSNFNGVVYPTIFDKAEAVTTLGNDPSSLTRNFILQKNAIYKGKATVKNGLFQYTFIVPKDISYSVGKGKFSYYANDNTIDASGYDGLVNVGAIADSSIKDKVGPNIKIYMNDLKFANGGNTDPNPTMIVKLQDQSGINTAGNGIGHDITLTLDNDNKDKQTMNDYYESDLDNYQKGTINFPLKNLTAGAHTLKVKAWDVFNNSSESEIQFTVTSQKQLALAHVLNYPNPFTTHTTFFFEHNMPDQLLDVHITVFTITGKSVKTIRQQVVTDGYISRDDISWDGTDDFGDKLARGVYIYKITIKNNTGLSQSKIEKLVIL